MYSTYYYLIDRMLHIYPSLLPPPKSYHPTYLEYFHMGPVRLSGVRGRKDHVESILIECAVELYGRWRA